LDYSQCRQIAAKLGGIRAHTLWFRDAFHNGMERPELKNYIIINLLWWPIEFRWEI
jgi:hypothetical protein